MFSKLHGTQPSELGWMISQVFWVHQNSSFVGEYQKSNQQTPQLAQVGGNLAQKV
jgi:hypothetical protein